MNTHIEVLEEIDDPDLHPGLRRHRDGTGTSRQGSPLQSSSTPADLMGNTAPSHLDDPMSKQAEPSSGVYDLWKLR